MTWKLQEKGFPDLVINNSNKLVLTAFSDCCWRETEASRKAAERRVTRNKKTAFGKIHTARVSVSYVEFHCMDYHFEECQWTKGPEKGRLSLR